MSKNTQLRCGGHHHQASLAGGRRSFSLPGATRHWAPDRPGKLEHVRLELDLDLEARHLKGRCSTRLTILRQGSQRLKFSLRELQVERVSDGLGAELAWSHEGGTLEITLPSEPAIGDRVEVVVDYAGHPRTGLNFQGPDAEYPDRPWQAWSQGQDEYARYWFPAHDSPNERCTSEVIVTVPERFETISNGSLVERRPGPRPGTSTWHWSEAVPHSAYLVSLVVGEFEHWEDDADGVALHFYAPPGQREAADRAYAGTAEMVRHFSQLLDEPFPFEKYAQVVVRDFTWGGMENSSATTLYDGILFDEKGAQDVRIDTLIAHELAHQWFGDLLTCREWAHGWLNEGFATYFEQVWYEHHHGLDEASWLRRQDSSDYLAEDSTYRRPIVERSYGIPNELFDRHLYEKGGQVLWMLRWVVGDEAFVRGLRAYVKRHRLGQVTTDDLQKVFEDTTGLGLGWFFEQWLYRAGYPEFKVSYSFDSERSVAHLTVAQTQKLEGETPLFRMPVEIAFGMESGVERRRVTVSLAEDGFDFELPGRPRWVRFDAGNHVLKTLDFERPLELLLAQLSEDDVSGRAEAAVALGRLATAPAVTALGRSLVEDQFWGVGATCAEALASARTTQARDLLLANCEHPRPRVRQAIAAALGSWYRDPEVAAALRRLISTEQPYRTAAAAALALGRVEGQAAIPELVRAFEIPSALEVVRMSAAQGLRQTRSAEALEPLLEFSRRPGILPRARGMAVNQAGALGSGLEKPDRERVRTELESRLHHSLFQIRAQAMRGLGALGDPAAIPALESYRAREVEQLLAAEALAAIESLRSGGGSGDEVKALRSEVDRLKERETQLRDRLEKLEAARPAAD